jgi:hypothetical protein
MKKSRFTEQQVAFALQQAGWTCPLGMEGWDQNVTRLRA